MTRYTRPAKTFLFHSAKQVALCTLLCVGTMFAFAQTHPTHDATDTPLGIWQTIDDKTGQPKALVHITQQSDGTLSGTVIKGLGPNNQPGRRCTACQDARKDQPILGMTIIDGMKKEKDHWDGGEILDPENGKTYHCKMHLEDDGKKLVVRGYMGVSLFGRSQTWVRQP